MRKNNIIIGLVSAVTILVLLTVVVSNNKSSKTKSKTVTPAESEVIPTVDSSVKVDLKAKNNRKAIELTIEDIPNITTSIEYSLSYQTKSQGLQGIIGVLKIEEGDSKKTLSRELGTCSSGTCVYHDVVGKVKLELKFNGNYGERIFEKEYEI